MDIFSLCNEKSIKAIYNELEQFRLQSGFTVSYEKTTLYRIGSLRHSNAQMYDLDSFVWSNQDISVLGVTIAHEDIIEKNYRTIVQKARNTLNAWTNRGLSIIGKVEVVNTLVASLFVYKMMVLPTIPRGTIKNLENMIRYFIWNGKKSKIAYKTLQLPKKEGGLNLVNFANKDKALKTTWPQILDQEKEYSQIVYGIMRCPTLGSNIWRCRISPQDISLLKFDSTFWKDVWISWSEYNYHSNFRIENQIIWHNSCVKLGKKTIFWRDNYEKGLMYIHQLFSENGFKPEQQLMTNFGLTRLRINNLKSAIPKEWKEFFTTPRILYYPLPPDNYQICLNETGLAKKVYSYFAGDAI